MTQKSMHSDYMSIYLNDNKLKILNIMSSILIQSVQLIVWLDIINYN